MLTWEELKEAKLGETFAVHDLERCCRGIYGGIAWPGKNPGFVVVVAMSLGKENVPDSHEICVLDEFESFDTWELIRQCRRLNVQWEPELWVGDTNNAADEFINRMNEDHTEPHFDMSRSYLLDDMEPPCLYPYILGTVRRLTEKSCRLCLKDGKVSNYLLGIKGDEIATLERGDFPAIEALGYAVEETEQQTKILGPFPINTAGDLMPDEGEFDHLLRPGARDPGPEYDDDDW